MDRTILFKYIFLLIVGFLVIGISIYSFFGDKKEDVENPFENVQEVNESDVEDDILEPDFSPDPVENDDYEDDEGDTDEGIGLDEPSMGDIKGEGYQKAQTSGQDQEEVKKIEEAYIKKHGKEKFKKAKDQARQIVDLWVKKESDLSVWKKKAPGTYLEKIEEDIDSFEDEQFDIFITEDEVFGVKSSSENEIKIGVFAQWEVISGGYTLKEEAGLFYVSFQVTKDQLTIKEFQIP
ncbi:hypothetical protein ACFSCZ_00545 [Siminovitchia sediminis]|uniref:Uncharacterized protein n=1 Tax=Siminovitchia sediminis TaxID=1274353 RepID=A0ABW4KE26_9BACI